MGPSSLVNHGHWNFSFLFALFLRLPLAGWRGSAEFSHSVVGHNEDFLFGGESGEEVWGSRTEEGFFDKVD